MRCTPAIALLSALLSSPALAQVQEFVAHIDHDEVGSGSGSRARGRGRFLYDAAADTLDFFIEFGGLEGSEFAAHLHINTCGGSPTLLGLPPGNPKVGVLSIPDALECALIAGESYVNIHTDLHPTGEIAGFVVPVPDTVSSYCQGIGCPCGNDDALAGCANSTGSGAKLSTVGTASVLHDSLELFAGPIPSGKSGLFFMGSLPAQQPFGDGQRCVAGELYRFAVRVSNGTIHLGPGLVQLSRARLPRGGVIRVGATWYLQAWYQDLAGPCGSGFNLSDAVEVLFTP